MASLTRKRRYDMGKLSLMPSKRARGNDYTPNASTSKKRSWHQMDVECLPQSSPKRLCINTNAGALNQGTTCKPSVRELLFRELPMQCKSPPSELNENIQNLYNVLHKPHQEGNISEEQKPLFTFNDVRRIAEVLLKEHEEKLLEKFERTMVTEMARQYDVYVKFTYDQIAQRYNEVPTYMS